MQLRVTLSYSFFLTHTFLIKAEYFMMWNRHNATQQLLSIPQIELERCFPHWQERRNNCLVACWGSLFRIGLTIHLCVYSVSVLIESFRKFPDQVFYKQCFYCNFLTLKIIAGSWDNFTIASMHPPLIPEVPSYKRLKLGGGHMYDCSSV
jgi:hypothetical protein